MSYPNYRPFPFTSLPIPHESPRDAPHLFPGLYNNDEQHMRVHICPAGNLASPVHAVLAAHGAVETDEVDLSDIIILTRKSRLFRDFLRFVSRDEEVDTSPTLTLRSPSPEPQPPLSSAPPTIDEEYLMPPTPVSTPPAPVQDMVAVIPKKLKRKASVDVDAPDSGSLPKRRAVEGKRNRPSRRPSAMEKQDFGPVTRAATMLPEMSALGLSGLSSVGSGSLVEDSPRASCRAAGHADSSTTAKDTHHPRPNHSHRNRGRHSLPTMFSPATDDASSLGELRVYSQSDSHPSSTASATSKPKVIPLPPKKGIFWRELHDFWTHLTAKNPPTSKWFS